MSTELIINASLPETRIALLENGEIQEILVERASGKGIVGNIYKGRVTRVLPGMQAAFVDIGLEKAAFLYVDDVYQHSEIWEAEEGGSSGDQGGESEEGGEGQAEVSDAQQASSGQAEGQQESQREDAPEESSEESDEDSEQESDDSDDAEDSEDSDDEPVSMGAEGEGGEGGGGESAPAGTVAPQSGDSRGSEDAGARRQRRGRRGGRNRRRGRDRPAGAPQGAEQAAGAAERPEVFHEQMEDEGHVDSDRAELGSQGADAGSGGELSGDAGRPAAASGEQQQVRSGQSSGRGGSRPEFRENRDKFRRIKSSKGAGQSGGQSSGKSGGGRDAGRDFGKHSKSGGRSQVNIQDLLKEGQEVLVQVAKDPIATKGARLTCHISLPGRHLVCMPTIDHVGVSKRIERDDERRKLRDFVERNRPAGLGFIVRTASGKQQSERRLKQDMEYLSRLWEEIQEKARNVSAPALVYEDLNAVLRAIRDWVNEEIDRIVVDSRYQYNDIQRFVAHFMPSLRQKVELYQGDVPIFDQFGISSELARALDRKVWLKSGGYIVIDQAEALVAIDVNTGRFVGKKNLEDTIVKTNLEAVQEIAYQLRLRNCGGIIILDLIDMDREESKQRVYRALEEALKKDRARPTIQKISDLGLIEMTRKRTRDTMVRMLCESCSHCEGKGFVKSRQTVAYEVLRDVERDGIDRDVRKILVQAHTEVIDLLALDERETLDQLERRYRKPIFLQAVEDFHLEQFEVIADRAPGTKAKDKVGKQGERERRAERMAERQREREQREKERQSEREAVRARLEAQRQSQALAGGQASHEAPVDAGEFMAEEGGEPSGQQQPQLQQGQQEQRRDHREQRDHRGGGRGRDRDHRGRDRDRGHDRGQHQPQQNQQRRQPSEAELDPDSIGNRVDYRPRGKNAANYFYQGEIITGETQPVYEGLPQDEEMTEEDRRAFERAQAIQDNALSRLSQQGGNFVPGKPQGQMRANGGSGGGGGGGGRDRDGGRRGRRGRRGGRGRHDRGDRGGDHRGNRDDRGNRSSHSGGQGGGGSDSGGGQGGGNDSGGGGGGDFSQPPV